MNNVNIFETIKQDCKKWETLPLFQQEDKEEIAQRYIRTYLCHSYLLNRFIFPSLGWHLFDHLLRNPPLNDVKGPIVKHAMHTLIGELCNNNVYQRSGECHSHFQDYAEAYIAAGGNKEELDQFTALEDEHGFDEAMKRSPLWSKTMQDYVLDLLVSLQDTNTSFLINFALEECLHKQFKVILALLPPADSKYDKLRIFFSRHIEFDEGEHVPAMQSFVSTFMIEKEGLHLANTLDFIQGNCATYLTGVG